MAGLAILKIQLTYNGEPLGPIYIHEGESNEIDWIAGRPVQLGNVRKKRKPNNEKKTPNQTTEKENQIKQQNQKITLGTK